MDELVFGPESSSSNWFFVFVFIFIFFFYICVRLWMCVVTSCVGLHNIFFNAYSYLNDMYSYFEFEPWTRIQHRNNDMTICAMGFFFIALINVSHCLLWTVFFFLFSFFCKLCFTLLSPDRTKNSIRSSNCTVIAFDVNDFHLKANDTKKNWVLKNRK